MSDQAESQAPAPTFAETGGQQEQQAPDPVMSRLDELAQSIASLRPPEPEAEPEYDYAFDDSDFDPNAGEWDEDNDPGEPYEQGYEPEVDQEAMQQLDRMINERIQQGVQQAVSPFMIQQKAAQLEQKYPDLQQPEVAQRVVQSAERFAHMVGQSSGLTPQQVNSLARSPELIERLYLAERAQSRAGQETPADGGPGAHLEGNSAQVEQPEADFFDGLINAGRNDNNNRFGWK